MTQVRIGILSFAHMHAYSYAAALAARPDALFAGVWDDDAERGRAQATLYGVPFFDTPEALVAQSLDGVIVTSENAGHRRLVEAAAASPIKAILCEKPLATTREDAAAMVHLCQEEGVFLATAFPCRYSPAFARALAVARNGGLGDILALRATNHGQCPFGWFVEKEKSGGGAVIDHTVHVADLNRVLLGREAVEVYAQTGNGMYHQDWEDTGFLTITYDGGVFTTLDTSWSRPPKSFSTWGDVTMEIVGTGGVLSLDLFSQALTHYSEAAGKMQSVGWGSNLDAGLVTDFLRAARDETPELLATGEDGARALDVALAAYELAATGQPVRLG